MGKCVIMTGGSGGTGSDECTARKADVLKGKKAVTSDSGDEAAEGTLEVQSIVNFKVVQYSNLTLIASWDLPSIGPWSGVIVRCKQGDYPMNVNDGTLFYEGNGRSCTKSLVAGTWYFRAWSYITTNYEDKIINVNHIYLHEVIVNNETVTGTIQMTESGTITVPNAVYSVQFFAVGGGGQGTSAAGGGGGYTATSGWIGVVPGTQFYAYVGRSREASYVNNTQGARIITANGTTYSPGGSGGGKGGSSGYDYGGNGGADGSNGGSSYYKDKNGYTGGQGQGRTTRAFGESWNGAIYAGGGGGNSSTNNWNGRGNGGAGGGGIGACIYEGAGGGGYATGGGGGGGRYTDGAGGGTGVILMRW